MYPSVQNGSQKWVFIYHQYVKKIRNSPPPHYTRYIGRFPLQSLQFTSCNIRISTHLHFTIVWRAYDLDISQVIHRSGRRSRDGKRPRGPADFSSEIDPSFFFLSLSNFDLKPFTDFADTVSWSSMFQWLTTHSEKWRWTLQLQRCLTSLNEWPRVLVLLLVFISKNLVNGMGERFFANLKTSMRFEPFLHSSKVYLGGVCQFLHSRNESGKSVLNTLQYIFVFDVVPLGTMWIHSIQRVDEQVTYKLNMICRVLLSIILFKSPSIRLAFSKAWLHWGTTFKFLETSNSDLFPLDIPPVSVHSC